MSIERISHVSKSNSAPKYVDRPEMYLETAIKATNKVIEEAEAQPATFTNDTGDSAGTVYEACAARCAALVAQVETLQARTRMLRDTLSRQWAVVRNPNPGSSEKIAGLAMLHDVALAQKMPDVPTMAADNIDGH